MHLREYSHGQIFLLNVAAAANSDLSLGVDINIQTSSLFQSFSNYYFDLSNIMLVTPHKPPILRLSHDLLWHILKMNADMFLDDNALKTTRMTSQVCRHWRNFMLSTSSLWAKLVDLNSLEYHTMDAWRNELMRRTGTALLWIAARKYPIPNDSTGIISFFFDIVSKNWHRIQKLVIVGINVKHIEPMATAVYSLVSSGTQPSNIRPRLL